MKSGRKYNFTLCCLGFLILAFAIQACETEKPEEILKVSPKIDLDFPDFITSTEDYFDTRIASVPSIDVESYELKISGAIENPTSFTLEELSKLNMVEKTLTIECIGNSANGRLIGTAGWKSDAPMSIDSKIFFPESSTRFALGDSIKVGGTAFGSKRIFSVELTLDNGSTWIPASITRQVDEDYVWVFWTAYIIPDNPGSFAIRSRATATDGSVQEMSDAEYSDGTNSWPKVNITVL